MPDKLQQIQDVLGFNNSPGTGNSENEPGSPEATTFSATSPDVPLDDELESEFQQHFTYHSFASHPLSKLSIVALGAAGVVGVLVLFYSLVGNPMAGVHSENPEQKNEEAPKEKLFSPDPQKNEKDQLLAQLALSQQAQQMERHRSRSKAGLSTESKPSQASRLTGRKGSSISDSEPLKRSPRLKEGLQPDTTPNTRYTSMRTLDRPSPGRERFYPVDAVNPRRSVRPIPLVSSDYRDRNSDKPRATNATEGDPQKRWQDLAALGSFKAETKDVKNFSSREIIPGLPKNDQKQATDATPIAADISGESVPVQKLKGRIEGGIAVPANRTNSAEDMTENLEVSIVLDEPLLDKDSRQVVPNGARLMAKVKINGPMISFLPSKLAFEIDGQYQEVELEPGAIAISGSNGPLIAEIKTVGADGGGLSANGLAQLATALGGIAGIDKATNLALVFNALAGYNSRSSRNEGIRVYTVNDGTPLTVRLTRPLNLPLPAEGEKTHPELNFQ